MQMHDMFDLKINARNEIMFDGYHEQRIIFSVNLIRILCRSYFMCGVLGLRSYSRSGLPYETSKHKWQLLFKVYYKEVRES